MRRHGLLTLIIALLLSIVTPASLVQAEERSSLIEDPVLEQSIRKELGISDRELTSEDMKGLISLYPQYGTEKIKSLKGLEYAVNLMDLVLPGHAVEDLTPLSELWNLNTLDISSNGITNVCPLESIYSLEKLILSNNRIKSIDCLSGLWYLTDLLADGNEIEDVTVLVHLPLDRLNLENNRISDLSPLKGHPDLENLYLANNRIEDIRILPSLPVLENVHLQGNPLKNGAQQAIEELEGLGVRVNPSPEQQQLNPMKVYVDGVKVRFSLPPVNEKGTTLVQFRPLFEKLGLTVSWEEETRKVTGQKEGTRIVLQIGEKSARVNDTYKNLEQAPCIIDGSTFVPARFVAEALGHAVSYDHESNSVWIDTGKRLFTNRIDEDDYKGPSYFSISGLAKGAAETPSTLSAYMEQYRSKLNNVIVGDPVYFTVKGLQAVSISD